VAERLTPQASDDDATNVREPLFERPGVRPPSLRDFRRDVSVASFLNAVAGLVFGITGPVAVTMSVGLAGGLTGAQLASWVFAIFLSGGAATLVMSLIYRRPLGFAFSIPGTVLLGPSLQHLSFPEVVGAFFTAGMVTLALGMSGLVRRVMGAVPQPVVMAMVAAVFLDFGLDIIREGRSDPWVVVPMIVVFVGLSMVPSLSRLFPPVLGAMIIGLIVVWVVGRFDVAGDGPFVVRPVIASPEFTWAAQLELVVPLVLTVLVVQNGQGAAVLRSAGHEPPVNSSAVASGVMSLVNATFGGVSACLTGPTNALLTATGERQRQYSAAIVYAFLCFGVALFAPLVTQFMLGAPEAFILALGGLAMLAPLRAAFVTSFSSGFTFGALTTFLVTVAGFDPLNIHAAFWGVVIGYAVSRLLEPQDHR